MNTRSLNQSSTALKPIISRLYACYQEFYRSDRILVDHLASRALPEILADYPHLSEVPSSQRVAQLTSVIRSRCFDQAVTAFIENHPYGIVVNLGARLCTRYWRLPTPHPFWYEVDSPDVMEMRQRYFTIVPREGDISHDCMDFSWINEIDREDDQPILFILEGVCMYLEPEENQILFEAIAHHFPGADILFDVVSPKFMEQNADLDHPISAPQSEDFLGEWQAKFQWGMESLQDIDSWKLNAQLIQKFEYLLNISSYPERLENWMKTFWPILANLLKKSGQIYHIHLS